LSDCHFSHAFKASRGVSTRRWLNGRWIEQSKHLMATTPLPLAEVAILAGFADQSG